MPSPIHHMSVVKYYRDGRPHDREEIRKPKWSAVEAAIRQMDNYCFPVVQLNCTEYEDDEEIFNIIGGAGRFALFHMMGEWNYEDPNGGNDLVQLWESDQGYYCKERNVLTDLDKVLRITKVFYETGSYDGLDNVE